MKSLAQMRAILVLTIALRLINVVRCTNLYEDLLSQNLENKLRYNEENGNKRIKRQFFGYGFGGLGSFGLGRFGYGRYGYGVGS